MAPTDDLSYNEPYWLISYCLEYCLQVIYYLEFVFCIDEWL
jgi:hypothetical protein